MNIFLLQVTVGCAHNKCTYCSMYRDVNFKMEKLDQIEEDLKEARSLYGRVDRIFLVNVDAFVLKADYLKNIALKIKEYLPHCETITMYASIQNIKAKTDEELRELRALGINELYVGIESGVDEVLSCINKGHNLQEAKKQLERLNEANITHRALLMLGVAGKGKGEENAIATAKLLNETKPDFGEVLKPSGKQAEEIVKAFKSMGKEKVFEIMVESEFKGGPTYEKLGESFEKLKDIAKDEIKHGNMLKGFIYK